MGAPVISPTWFLSHLADGVMVELGDFYSGEQRRLLMTLDVPAMAALG